MSDIRTRLDKLESQDADDRPAYRSFTSEQWAAMSQSEQERAADGCKVYIGWAGPDAWDRVPPFDHEMIAALARGETPPGYVPGQADAMTDAVFNLAAINRMLRRPA